jgi:hypothetical protein
MKGFGATIRAVALLLLVAIVAAGCGLFNDTTTSQPGQQSAQGADLGQIVMAEQIDPSTNAPVNQTDSFTGSPDTIYAVVEAKRIDSGTSMFARWSRDGKPFEDSTAVTANQDYQNRYVEFHLQSNQQQIDPGNYTVQIFVNGNPATQTDFTVQ